MKKKNNAAFLNPIEAIIPMYDHLGNNTCQVIYASGVTTSPSMNTTKFIKEWFYTLRSDLYAMRLWAAEILNQRNLNPIVIDQYIILIPVRLRHAIGEKDGCYGYIRLTSIKALHPDYILLTCGKKIPYLSSIKTIRQKIQHGKLLGYTYKEELRLQQMIYRKEIKEEEDLNDDLFPDPL